MMNQPLTEMNQLKKLKLQGDLLNMMASSNSLENQSLYNTFPTSFPYLMNSSVLGLPKPELSASRFQMNAISMAYELAARADRELKLRQFMESKGLIQTSSLSSISEEKLDHFKQSAAAGSMAHHNLKVEETTVKVPKPVKVSRPVTKKSPPVEQGGLSEYYSEKVSSYTSSQHVTPKRPHSDLEEKDISARESRRSRREKKAADKQSDRAEQAINYSQRLTRRTNKIQTMQITQVIEEKVEKKPLVEVNLKEFLKCVDSPTIQVGLQSQAVVPAVEKKFRSSRREFKQVWNPSVDCDYQGYFKRIIEIIGGQIKEERALRFLKWKNYDSEEALRIIKKKKNYFRDSMTIREEDIERKTPSFK
jgi:hypothetical protein